MDLGTLLHAIKVALVLIVMISVLVAAHEYGHYLFARIFKMGVEEFAIGFGNKPLVIWMRKTYKVASEPGEDPQPLTETTDFTVRPWPLGGFVRIKGMVPEDDGSETKIPGGFYSKPPWQRFLVLLAGPVFSVLAGVIILTGVYASYGVDKLRDEPKLDSMSKKGAAYLAGLRPGDRILTLDGQKMSTFIELTKYVRPRAEKPIKVEYLRDGKTLTAMVTPTKGQALVFTNDLDNPDGHTEGGRIGASPEVYHVNPTFSEAVVLAVNKPVQVISGLIGLIKKPSEFKDSVGGPGTIAKVTSEATKEGLDQVIGLAAMLSISVGIFNLLPVPPLDGGQMLVALAEMLRGGRRLSMKVQGAVTAVGLALVAMLFISVLFIDVGRLSKPDMGADQIATQNDKPQNDKPLDDKAPADPGKGDKK